MSVVLHWGRWQLWLGAEPRWPFMLHAGRCCSYDDDFSFGLVVEIY